MDKNKSTWKLWRLIKVLYFIITIPLVWLWAWALLLSQEIRRWSYDSGIQINDYYIWALYMILFLISYLLLTDLIRRIISYINNWTFNWFIPYIKILKKFSILIIIIWWIISFILFSLSKNLRNECTWNNEWFNDYWVCSCYEWYIKENWSCKKDIKIYDNWEISFSYPWKLIIDNKEFEIFKFFEKENIFVKKYNFENFTNNCFWSWWWLPGEYDINWKLTKEWEKRLLLEKNNIKEVIWNIIKWNFKKDDFFDHISCWSTIWPIKTTPILVNWINWVLINYYFTQDRDMACLSQFNTELLLVKDLDNIYSIVFKNNFWNVLNYLNQFKWEYWEACLIDFEWEFRSKNISDNIVNFYKNWNSLYWTDYEWFEENYNVVKEIINTIKIK